MSLGPDASVDSLSLRLFGTFDVLFIERGKGGGAGSVKGCGTDMPKQEPKAASPIERRLAGWPTVHDPLLVFGACSRLV